MTPLSDSLRRASQFFSAAYADQSPELTLTQVTILKVLDGAGRGERPVLRQTDVQIATGVDRSTTQDTIARLAHKGYVQVTRTSHDRRTSRVIITKIGTRALRAADRAILKAEGALAQKVSNGDFQPFLRALRAIGAV